jgi:XTP/dITP diphosphohydrolase
MDQKTLDNNRREILIATENRGKAKEISEIFKDTPYRLRFLFLYEFRKVLGDFEIHENAKTFEGNAIIKAILVGKKLGLMTLADDSGLVVRALDGRPGVYSARYSQEGTDAANNDKVLQEMKDIPENERECYYNCTVAIFDPGNNFIDTVSGQWHGRVATEPRGEKSFGYAPIFLAKEFDYQKTNAELEHEELIKINHTAAKLSGQRLKFWTNISAGLRIDQ